MEQKIRFGLVLWQLAILKKKWGAIFEQLLRVLFFMFSGAKKYVKIGFFLNIVASTLKGCIK
jgi:hypothetical protein